MANISYQDLFWQVRIDLPGVPLPLLFANYAEATREFFSRSLAWQYNIPNLLDIGEGDAWPTLVEGTDYPNMSYVVQPVKVKWVDGTIITFKTRDQLDEIDATWETATGSKPDYWTITSPLTWRLYPLLDDDMEEKIILRVALAPEASATEIPEELAREFQELWMQGTLARLFRIPGKDWTDLNLSAANAQMYDAGIKMAKSRAAADFGRPDRAVQYGGLSIGGSGRKISDYGR